jgi:L-iditol 2-dehydrogenase
MRVARYLGQGQVAIAEEPEPALPEGGLVVQTEACGLCSGELMEWYLDQKVPHVLGHEVAGKVIESDDDRFPVGSRIFPHHHAPCLHCDFCHAGLYVHCDQWKRTRLAPGGMGESFSVSQENLNDTMIANDLRPVDAALIEPLGCVVKSLARAPLRDRKVAVIGMGVMGLLHMLVLERGIGYEISRARMDWARRLGLDARHPDDSEPADVIFVCPGSEPAVRFAIDIARPGAHIVLFAPLPPQQDPQIPINRLYFGDMTLTSSYSCGPDDTTAAAELLRSGRVKAEQVVSHFITLDELPNAYQAMKRGDILKPMVVFP